MQFPTTSEFLPSCLREDLSVVHIPRLVPTWWENTMKAVRLESCITSEVPAYFLAVLPHVLCNIRLMSLFSKAWSIDVETLKLFHQYQVWREVVYGH